jgi:hypothetical protein
MRLKKKKHQLLCQNKTLLDGMMSVTLIVFNKYGEKAEEFEEAKFEFADAD